MKHDVYVTRQVKNLGHNNAAALVKKAVSAALDGEKINCECSLSVLFTDDEGIRAINREFRAKDTPTDVLSFPMNELTPGSFDPQECEKDMDSGKVLLGDMVIDLNRCQAQGEEFGHGFEREIAYLTVHSVLHLLGYDHMDEGPQKALMRAREKEIMGDKN